MKGRLVTRIVSLAVGLALIAVVILGFRFLRQQLNRPGGPDKTEEEILTAAGEETRSGPFSLRTTMTRMGGKSYVSFEVYFINDTNSELLYSCGRMFPAEDVISIAWEDGDNIAVTLINGKKEIFTYDGSSQWR